MIHNFPALVAFVRTSDNGLYGVKQLENAQKVLEQLLKEGTLPRRILSIIAKSRFCNELFNVLLVHYEGTPEWSAFEDAVITSHGEWNLGGSCILDASLVRFFGLVEDQEALIRRHRDLLLNENLPFLKAMDPDRHWRQKVCWYIAGGNLERAWDELKRASRGLYISDSYTPEQLLHGDACYAFAASSSVFVLLVTDLFVASSKKFDIFLDDDERWEYPLHTLHFNPSARGMLARISYKLDSVVMVSKVGAQIALLSRHFAGLESNKRRKKIRRKTAKLEQ